MTRVRPAAVAGMFYPGRAAELRADVRRLLEAAERQLPVDPPHRAAHLQALVVPHAGYVYSGSTAALGYAALARRHAEQPVRRVVLLGPTHRVAVAGLALPEVDACQTPLGQVTVDLVSPQLRQRLPQLVDSVAAHAQEHSLEVQLPFLQSVLPEATVLPLAVGRAEPELVADALDLLWHGPDIVAVVSSDLSHFHRHDEAIAIDSETMAQVARLDASITHEQACGATPLNGLLVAAARRRLTASVLGRCTSADTAGDRKRVVGYGAVAFHGSETC